MKTIKKRLLPATQEPEFKSVEEAAEWYDTHDTSQLPGEEVIAEPGGAAATHLETVAVRISSREIEELKRRSARLGVGYTTYMRMLINKHIADGGKL